MNIQSAKARAIPLARSNGKQVWRVTHPLTDIEIHAFNPVHAAQHLLREYVLPRQVELMREAT